MGDFWFDDNKSCLYKLLLCGEGKPAQETSSNGPFELIAQRAFSL